MLGSELQPDFYGAVLDNGTGSSKSQVNFEETVIDGFSIRAFSTEEELLKFNYSFLVEHTKAYNRIETSSHRSHNRKKEKRRKKREQFPIIESDTSRAGTFHDSNCVSCATDMTIGKNTISVPVSYGCDQCNISSSLKHCTSDATSCSITTKSHSSESIILCASTFGSVSDAHLTPLVINWNLPNDESMPPSLVHATADITTSIPEQPSNKVNSDELHNSVANSYDVQSISCHKFSVAALTYESGKKNGSNLSPCFEASVCQDSKVRNITLPICVTSQNVPFSSSLGVESIPSSRISNGFRDSVAICSSACSMSISPQPIHSSHDARSFSTEPLFLPRQSQTNIDYNISPKDLRVVGSNGHKMETNNTNSCTFSATFDTSYMPVGSSLPTLSYSMLNIPQNTMQKASFTQAAIPPMISGLPPPPLMLGGSLPTLFNPDHTSLLPPVPQQRPPPLYNVNGQPTQPSRNWPISILDSIYSPVNPMSLIQNNRARQKSSDRLHRCEDVRWSNHVNVQHHRDSHPTQICPFTVPLANPAGDQSMLDIANMFAHNPNSSTFPTQKLNDPITNHKCGHWADAHIRIARYIRSHQASEGSCSWYQRHPTVIRPVPQVTRLLSPKYEQSDLARSVCLSGALPTSCYTARVNSNLLNPACISTLIYPSNSSLNSLPHHCSNELQSTNTLGSCFTYPSSSNDFLNLILRSTWKTYSPIALGTNSNDLPLQLTGSNGYEEVKLPSNLQSSSSVPEPTDLSSTSQTHSLVNNLMVEDAIKRRRIEATHSSQRINSIKTLQNHTSSSQHARSFLHKMPYPDGPFTWNVCKLMK